MLTSSLNAFIIHCGGDLRHHILRGIFDGKQFDDVGLGLGIPYSITAQKESVAFFIRYLGYIHLHGRAYAQRSGDDIGKLPIPQCNESDRMAKMLTYADREIELLHQDIEQERQKKKALMQLLLTGIVRV